MRRASRIVLIGTSRGTISAAYLGRNPSEPVDAVVLTSALFAGGQRWGNGLAGFDYRTMRSVVREGCPAVQAAHDAIGSHFILRPALEPALGA